MALASGRVAPSSSVTMTIEASLNAAVPKGASKIPGVLAGGRQVPRNLNLCGKLGVFRGVGDVTDDSERLAFVGQRCVQSAKAGVGGTGSVSLAESRIQ